MDAFVFADHDLADNLFGLAPLVNQGLTATFSNTKVSFDAPTSSGSRTILYGTKNPTDNVWYFSLPQHPHKAFPVVRNETQAEIALYAMASFGHPSFRAFHRAVQLGYLSNYPDLTACMLRRNRPHTPATALGHITASRSNIRSTRRRPKLQDVSDTSSSDSAAPKLAQAVTRSHFKHLRQPNLDPTPRKRVRIVSPTDLSFTTTDTMHHPILENLTQYQPHQLPDIFIRAKVLHSSDFRHDAIFSDLPGRFPVSAVDGSQYLLVSVFKRYIHVEPLRSRSTDQLIAAYSASHRWFQAHGHHPEFQILDNEAPQLLLVSFTKSNIAYQLATPFNKRTNKRSFPYSPAPTPPLPSIGGPSSCPKPN